MKLRVSAYVNTGPKRWTLRSHSHQAGINTAGMHERHVQHLLPRKHSQRTEIPYNQPIPNQWKWINFELTADSSAEDNSSMTNLAPSNNLVKHHHDGQRHQRRDYVLHATSPVTRGTIARNYGEANSSSPNMIGSSRKIEVNLTKPPVTPRHESSEE